MPSRTADGFDAESLLRSLMDDIPGAIYRAVNDAAWTVQTVSDEIESITGHPAADFVDASKLDSVTHPDDLGAVKREIAAALQEGRPWVLEYRVVHARGDIRWARRRIERDLHDLHDGAQQRLVVAASCCARRRTRPSPAVARPRRCAPPARRSRRGRR